MKNILIILFISCLYSKFYSQETSYQMNTTSSKENVLKYSEISGSPYLNDNFADAKAKCCQEIKPMRYDMYADQVEYKNGDITYILLKDKPYSQIEFINSKLILSLENIDNKPEYLILVVNGKNSLLKKISKRIETVSDLKKTGFGKKDQTSNFVENSPIFYIKNENGHFRLIKNKKDILDLFPDKNKELNDFFNINKIKFSKEESLAKVVNFLNN